MMSVSEALAHVRDHALDLGSEAIPVREALNRVLAEGIHAQIDMPPFPSSSMDGYAVSYCNVGDTLTLLGESAAGTPFHDDIESGEAVRISTGAVLPAGTDRVLIQECAEAKGRLITVKAAPSAGLYVRSKASDFKTDELIVPKNTRLSPAHLTLCAAANHVTLPVRRKPKVALISSGNELRRLGQPLEPGEIIAANAIGLKALLETWGADVMDMGIVRDEIPDIKARLEALSDFDLIIPIGGASVGDHDLMRPTFLELGFSPVFYTVAIKPGKPCWMATRRSQIVFGLPGNPASAFVCAAVFLRPLLGLKSEFSTVTLDTPIEENGPRETYLRATVVNTGGQLIATPYPVQESYRLRPQASANALLRVPPMGGPYKAGDRLDVLRFDGLTSAW